MDKGNIYPYVCWIFRGLWVVWVFFGVSLSFLFCLSWILSNFCANVVFDFRTCGTVSEWNPVVFVCCSNSVQMDGKWTIKTGSIIVNPSTNCAEKLWEIFILHVKHNILFAVRCVFCPCIYVHTALYVCIWWWCYYCCCCCCHYCCDCCFNDVLVVVILAFCLLIILVISNFFFLAFIDMCVHFVQYWKTNRTLLVRIVCNWNWVFVVGQCWPWASV